MSERLQKWLAGRGVASRRQAEAMITAGRISVNGEIAELGMKVDGTERVEVDGKLIRTTARKTKQRTIIYHKPPGEICTRSDPQGRRTIFESLPKVLGARWVTVGRLDYQTSGLLILTTDGELANKLMHPSSELQREYSVRALGDLSDQQLARLQSGVKLEDGEAKFDDIQVTDAKAANKSYRVVISEGRNRIVRRLFEHVGCRVNRLMRVRYGPVPLPHDLRPGKYRELGEAEIKNLRNAF
ncbi:MAG: 23S rRNA pseudouridylate synthase B [Chromatiales bacterium]|jgi:23S rRNA pseudouridine2605 synthase|nr:23S rRNA pseudouridylate synthase B [Chromatiales bacterium]MDP6151248.1 pseudouridine synthase [Gammaproteobacteria bacterium]MDP7270215.1 pseudouridine synthase [Gammaproteobacteria bacterium]HJP05074.1 pseudouridine synthase [Gammaproteobacteria bacterium]